jgi:hypothetical protein
MFFSGQVVGFGCTQCGYESARQTPTSILFWIGLAAAATAFMVPALSDALGLRWWYWVVVPLAELVLIVLLQGFLVWLRDALVPIPKKCPQCSGLVERKYGGFYDFGCMPTVLEMLLFLILIAGHVILLRRVF